METASPRSPGRPTIVVRTLNEAGCIGKVLAEMPAELAPCVLVVDGGSTDGTPGIVERLGFRVIQQEGRGLGRAILSGVRAAETDVIVLLCGDGSYDPAGIPRLLAKLAEGYDMVVSSRYSDGPEEAGMFSPRRRSTSRDDTLLRGLGNRMFTGLCRALFGFPGHDVLNGFKAFRRDVLGPVTLAEAAATYDLEMLLNAHRWGFRIGEIPVVERRRIAGETKVPTFSFGARLLWVVLRERVRPVRPLEGSDGR